MKVDLKVQYGDGREELVTAKFADFVGFERTWQRSIARLEHEVRLTDLAWLAWSALTRAGRTTLKFDPEWIATVDGVDMVDAPGENPLEMTQPPT